MIKLFTAAALLCSIAVPATAGVTSRTNYHYFTVHGSSASEIYDSLRSNAGLVGSGRTLANTEYTISSSAVKSKGPGCRVAGVNVSITYDVHLPRLANEAALPPSLRRDWRSFVGYLRGHEDRHRSLWMACVARYNSALKGLINGDCNNIDQRIDARWDGPERSCRRQNDSYNDYAEHALQSQPFMRWVRNGE